MLSKPRYLEKQVKLDLRHKMVFVAGPRQMGKTTLAKRIPGAQRGYLCWDVVEHREQILRRELPVSDLWIFDEIHKYRSWRNYLKGLYDVRGPKQRILVTGSARLDLYRFGGDSLQGRYHLLRMHPLSVAELGLSTRADLANLLALGGFPEPFFSGSEEASRRWSREYRNLLIREEVTSLEKIVDLGNLELLMLRLPELVGSPLSLNALREDLQVSHKTVSSWMLALERLFALFRVAPFGAPRLRAVKKEQKHYHFDWTVVPELSKRFENLVACHLLKWIHFQQDTKGRDLDLRYFRDIDRREVDFVVTENRKPLLFIECKWKDESVHKGLSYLKKRFPNTQSLQISATGTRDFQTPDGIRVCPAIAFLETLL